ncbi:MAG: hypothetical protein JWL83_4222 [Actinomycetia bacterium]|nr:hypothetical protein [Actinomycetes bacterium]
MRRRGGGRGEGSFLVWLVIGAGFSLGVLTAFTIGIFILPVTALLTLCVATRRARRPPA